MMTLEQIRQRNKAENAAAQRLQAAGYRLEGAARAGDRAGGPLLIGQADTAQAGQIGQAVTVGGAVLPGADRAGGHWFRLHLIHPHGAPGTGPADTVPGRHSFAAG